MLTSRASNLGVLALLLLLALAVYWPVFQILPFDEDNIYALGWVETIPAQALLAVDPTYYPEWRPLAYTALWIEQRIVASGPVAVHFAVNLAIWVLCAWLVFRITELLTRSRIAAALSAALILTDPRATGALVWIIERQSSMACAFGLAAMLLVVRAGDDRLKWPAGLALTALLLASALSKEHGIAFAMAVAAGAIARQRPDFAWPVAAAAAIYAALRMSVAGGTVTPYCEEMYFFATVRDVCLDLRQPAGWPQMAYNVAATLVNMPLLGLLSGAGAPIFAEYRLLTGVAFTMLAVVAVTRGPNMVRMLAVVPIATALLNFMIYRERNHLVGACALAILAGVGLLPALKMLKAPSLRIVAAATVAALLGTQAALAHALVVEHQAMASVIEPCQSGIRHRAFAPPFIARLKARYGLGDPQCLGKY